MATSPEERCESGDPNLRIVAFDGDKFFSEHLPAIREKVSKSIARVLEQGGPADSFVYLTITAICENRRGEDVAGSEALGFWLSRYEAPDDGLARAQSTRRDEP